MTTKTNEKTRKIEMNENDLDEKGRRRRRRGMVAKADTDERSKRNMTTLFTCHINLIFI